MNSRPLSAEWHAEIAANSREISTDPGFLKYVELAAFSFAEGSLAEPSITPSRLRESVIEEADEVRRAVRTLTELDLSLVRLMIPDKVDWTALQAARHDLKQFLPVADGLDAIARQVPLSKPRKEYQRQTADMIVAAFDAAGLNVTGYIDGDAVRLFMLIARASGDTKFKDESARKLIERTLADREKRSQK